MIDIIMTIIYVIVFIVSFIYATIQQVKQYYYWQEITSLRIIEISLLSLVFSVVITILSMVIVSFWNITIPIFVLFVLGVSGVEGIVFVMKRVEFKSVDKEAEDTHENKIN